MSEEKQSTISKLWQELIDAQRAEEQAKAERVAAKIEREQAKKRAKEQNK